MIRKKQNYRSYKTADAFNEALNFQEASFSIERKRFNVKIKPCNDVLINNGINTYEEFAEELRKKLISVTNIKIFVMAMQEYFKDKTFITNDFKKKANKNDLNIIINYYCVKYPLNFIDAYTSSIKMFGIGEKACGLIEDAKEKFNTIRKVQELNEFIADIHVSESNLSNSESSDDFPNFEFDL